MLTELLTSVGAGAIIVASCKGITMLSKDARDWIKFLDSRKNKRKRRET